ncbi:MAG: hypothetical protein Q4Q03_07675 [Bowdeniella nasicola]|nr:hypothetical protein [Bowdeniella nasicola]
MDTAALSPLLTRHEAATLMEVTDYKVRSWARQGQLVELHVDDQVVIPRICLVVDPEGEGTLMPHPAIIGTYTALRDVGLTHGEAFAWLATYNAEVGAIPLVELCTGHIHAVRRAIISTAL